MFRVKIKNIALGIILVIITAVIVSLFFPQFEQLPASAKEEVFARIAEADRVAIDPTIFPHRFNGPAIQLPGRDKVEEALYLIRFENQLLHEHCMCIGDVALRFYRGDQELIALTFHHGKSLRVLDTNWARNSNLYLTSESRAALTTWLTKNGYRPPPCSTNASAPSTQPD